MTIAVIDYTDAAQMRADYIARRARLYAPQAPEPVAPTPEPVPEPVVVAAPKPARPPKPVWKDPLAEYRHAYEVAIPADMQPQIGRQIMAEVAQEHGVAVYQMKSDIRFAEVTRARCVAMWRIADKTTLSLKGIGNLFNKDHTTVLHAIRRMNDETGENVRKTGGVRGAKALRPNAKVFDFQKAKLAVEANREAAR